MDLAVLWIAVLEGSCCLESCRIGWIFARQELASGRVGGRLQFQRVSEVRVNSPSFSELLPYPRVSQFSLGKNFHTRRRLFSKRKKVVRRVRKRFGAQFDNLRTLACARGGAVCRTPEISLTHRGGRARGEERDSFTDPWEAKGHNAH